MKTGVRRSSRERISVGPRLIIISSIALMLLGSSLVCVLMTGFAPVHSEPERRASIMAAPTFFGNLPLSPTGATWGAQLNLSTYVQDLEGDPLNVTWEWGDGTFSYNVLPASLPNKVQLVKNNHTYTPDYPQGQKNMTLQLNITVTDGIGTALKIVTIILTLPENGSPVLLLPEVTSTVSLAVDPSDDVTITARGSDPEGESLVWTFIFNNGTDDYRTVVMNTAATAPDEIVACSVNHVFGTEGNHTVATYISDAPDPAYQIAEHNISVNITVWVKTNTMPWCTAISYSPSGPLIDLPEQTSVIVDYWITARDMDGDILNVTWDFGDGSPLEYNESAGGTDRPMTAYQSKIYTDAGFENVTVTITDLRPGHEVVRTETILVNSTNLPPDIVKFHALYLSGGIYAEVNETIQFELILSDRENDTIEVVLDWGDGSPVIRFNMTEFVNNSATIYLNHTYTARGNYSIRINFTDNKIGLFVHNVSYSLKVEIRQVFETVVEGWGWWDYTSLALVCMIPIVIAARFYMAVQHRRRVEAEGFSMEEWKLLKEQQRDGGV